MKITKNRQTCERNWNEPAALETDADWTSATVYSSPQAGWPYNWESQLAHRWRLAAVVEWTRPHISFCGETWLFRWQPCFICVSLCENCPLTASAQADEIDHNSGRWLNGYYALSSRLSFVSFYAAIRQCPRNSLKRPPAGSSTIAGRRR